MQLQSTNTDFGCKNYELRSGAYGNFDIVDKTANLPRYSIDTNGNHNFTGNINAGGDLIVASKSVAIGTSSTSNAKVSIVGGAQSTTAGAVSVSLH